MIYDNFMERKLTKSVLYSEEWQKLPKINLKKVEKINTNVKNAFFILKIIKRQKRF